MEMLESCMRVEVVAAVVVVAAAAVGVWQAPVVVCFDFLAQGKLSAVGGAEIRILRTVSIFENAYSIDDVPLLPPNPDWYGWPCGGGC